MKRNYHALSLKDVRLTGGWLCERARVSREISLRDQYRKLVSSGRIGQLRRAAGVAVGSEGEEGHIFWDSDIAKWIEAVGCSLACYPDAELESLADSLIEWYAMAQEPDGYVNTYFSVHEPEAKWANLLDNHEMYCLGHLIEAAVAYRHGTGKDRFLEVAIRAVAHVNARFGPGPGTVRGCPGHEEIELALCRLYDATGDRSALDLARHLLDERGTSPNCFEVEALARGKKGQGVWVNRQAHKPVREQDEAVGHAVRAMYLYGGMADVAARANDSELASVCQRLWASVTERKMYVTGGVGARREGEALGDDFELPNADAYAETCAAIGLFLFGWRMNRIEMRSEHADTMERALYNGILSGISLDGCRYFYVNPLSYDGRKWFNRDAGERQEWFGTSCCPPNMARLLASLGGYVYSVSGNRLYTHLYASSEAEAELGGARIRLVQRTEYPWSGEVSLAVEPSSPVEAEIGMRVPGWCERYRLDLNGRKIAARVEHGYAMVARRWRGGDTLTLRMHMPVQQIAADSRAEQLRGCVALQRGPIVYCTEQCDNSVPVHALALPKNARFEARFLSELLGGCVAIEGHVASVRQADALYATRRSVRFEPTAMRAVPYALWGNRGRHPMTVWMARGTAAGATSSATAQHKPVAATVFC